MIRTEREYELARHRLAQGRQNALEYRAALEREGLDPQAIERLMQPVLAFHADIVDEVRDFERARNRDFGAVPLGALGQLLIGLRIASGLSQRDLAHRLGVHESTVSRDERNDYHGVTVERAQRILDAMGEKVELAVAPNQSLAIRSPAAPHSSTPMPTRHT